MLALAGLTEFVIRAAADHIGTVLDEVLDGAHQAQLAGLAIHNRKIDDAEARLQLGLFIQVVQDGLSLFTALQIEHDAHAIAVAFVADFGDALDLLFVDQPGAGFNQPRLVHLVGDLGNDDLLTILTEGNDLGFGPDTQAAATGAERVQNTSATEDNTARGEVRAKDDFADPVEGDVRLTNHQNGGFHNLAQVVRRDVGSHADGDPGGAVDEEIRDPGGENFGFYFAVVKVRTEVDGFLVDIFEKSRGDFREASFRISIRCGRVTINGTEVALAINQRIPQTEGLRHADESVVDGGVTVRVELTQHFADDLRAFPRGAIGRQAHFAHAIQNAAVDGFQPVTDIWQSAANDHAHRVIDIRPTHFVFDIYRDVIVVALLASVPDLLGRLGRSGGTLRGEFLISHGFEG